MRAAVYSGTRNVYDRMVTASKSLLAHSNVEKIYFLIEDDEFPQTLPPEIECINVSNQTYFSKDGPNFNNVCTYMVLIRAAYPKIFPHLDKILSIDVDTIVNENISDLWDLDLDNYYLAAVEEKLLTEAEGLYINMGVTMLNLKKMREDHKDDELIDALNLYWYRYKEQDCFNELCKDKILILPSDYNVCIQSFEPHREKITHFANIYNLDTFPHFNYYKNTPFEEIKRNQPDNITLDIIIPTYKNKKALIKTLSSIKKQNNVNVIVVDDYSELNYDDILIEYPYIHFYQLEKNQGPGMARQYGLEHSNGTYVTFLDSGDYFYYDGVNTILKEIQQNTYIKMYSFSYVFDDKNVLQDKIGDKTIGIAYKRSFINMYNINFSKEGSYANEDFGFVHSCKMIIDYLERRWHFHPMIKHIYMPTFYEHIDKNSLTKNNDSIFFYTKLAAGIVINGVHAIDIAKKGNVDVKQIIDELNYILALEYAIFLIIAVSRPEYADDAWQIIHNFYLNYYLTYEKFALKSLDKFFYQVTLPRFKSLGKKYDKQIQVNISKFAQEVKNEQFSPIKYLI